MAVVVVTVSPVGPVGEALVRTRIEVGQSMPTGGLSVVMDDRRNHCGHFT